MNYDISKTLGLVHYLAAMVAPFNLIEGVIWAIAFGLIYTLLQPILKNMKNKQQHWAKASFALLIFVILGYVIRFYPQQLTGFDSTIQSAIRGDLPATLTAFFTKGNPSHGYQDHCHLGGSFAGGLCL